MRTELVTIVTETTPLDGAYHMPEDGPVRRWRWPMRV